jgi:hypothetical protein
MSGAQRAQGRECKLSKYCKKLFSCWKGKENRIEHQEVHRSHPLLSNRPMSAMVMYSERAIAAESQQIEYWPNSLSPHQSEQKKPPKEYIKILNPVPKEDIMVNFHY